MFGQTGVQKQANGMEIMLRSMGLSQVVEAAQQLASSGAIERILKFSNEVGEINDTLRHMQRQLDAIGGAVACPHCGHSEPGGPGGVEQLASAPGEPGPDRQPGSPGDAGGHADG